jgi:hypothetical protein
VVAGPSGRLLEKEETMLHVNGKARRSARGHLVRGILAALALAVVCSIGASASAEDASAGADAVEAADSEALGPCEQSCARMWDLLVHECLELTGDAKAQCLDEARESYDACLADCP